MVEDGGLMVGFDGVMAVMSEFVALAATCKEAEWLKNLLLEIPVWVKPIEPISIRCDSAATWAKAYSQMYNRKSRHLVVRHSMIRELITNGVVSIEFVRSQQNLADHLTKGLAKDLVIKSAEGMRLKMCLEPAEKEDEVVNFLMVNIFEKMLSRSMNKEEPPMVQFITGNEAGGRSRTGYGEIPFQDNRNRETKQYDYEAKYPEYSNALVEGKDKPDLYELCVKQEPSKPSPAEKKKSPRGVFRETFGTYLGSFISMPEIQARNKVLNHCGLPDEEYLVLFTSSYRDAMMLVGESYPFFRGNNYMTVINEELDCIRAFAGYKESKIISAPETWLDLRIK
ncbi:hypothetical protein Tco_1181431, partial [Tanacetum coccineum]